MVSRAILLQRNDCGRAHNGTALTVKEKPKIKSDPSPPLATSESTTFKNKKKEKQG